MPVPGLCAAVAGLIVTGDIRGADANNAGLWLELDAILAVAIGGTSLLGGRFSILASLIGALIIQSINTGILLADLQSYQRSSVERTINARSLADAEAITDRLAKMVLPVEPPLPQPSPTATTEVPTP